MSERCRAQTSHCPLRFDGKGRRCVQRLSLSLRLRLRLEACGRCESLTRPSPASSGRLSVRPGSSQLASMKKSHSMYWLTVSIFEMRETMVRMRTCSRQWRDRELSGKEAGRRKSRTVAAAAELLSPHTRAHTHTHTHTPHSCVTHAIFHQKRAGQSRRPIAPTQVQVFSARGGSKMGLFREPVMRHLCVTTARRAQR